MHLLSSSSTISFLQNCIDPFVRFRSTKFIFAKTIAILVSLSLAGCASFGGPPLLSGATESEVIAKLGEPTHILQDANIKILEYMAGPFGQTTHFARINERGNLISYEQVLTVQKFAQIKIGVSTKQNVLRLIGTPSETAYLDLSELEIWSYPYLENPVSNSIMHVHFDRSGVVRKLLNGPDLRRDSDQQSRRPLRENIFTRMP